MKNKILLTFFSFLVFNFSYSQAIEEGDFVIETQMGFPNLSYFKSTQGINLFHLSLANSTTLNSSHKSIGQFIINSEFFLTDKLGLSLGFNYGYYYDYEEIETTEYIGNTGQYQTSIYFSEKNTHRFRIYIGPNFHFLRTERLDTYLGVKVGIKKSYITTNNNFPDNIYYGFKTYEFEYPVGLRVAYGLRFFVSEQLAISSEFGLGGPAVTLGLSYRIINKKNI